MVKMGSESHLDDATSTTGSKMYTPCSSSTAMENLWGDHFYSASGQAITLRNGSLCLQTIEDTDDEHSHWLCVEANGYLGFFNPNSGKYIGHNGKWDMQASAVKFLDWEYFTPRRHPDGGYQLLTPFWQHTLREVAVTDDGKRLVRRQHGITLWEL
ncbi:major facilitator superfamily transporter multidrug resistance [Trichoderma arundinaceum]|uniref:Major facilitator superfamily transporter multidrug resistance n=1 Tax=Trichoderma arundinaceum TaxID=490622 RepID=A0A395NF96_TRIAR|nr:major facilitator superfamily transporter multidrug resistance [Trichoderma arundinaceum]